jgi:chromosome segregation ATPase
MMKRLCVAVGVVATISLFGCAGCNRTTDKTPESTPEFRQIKTSLDESQKLNEQLKQDVQKLDSSLKEAESKLAETTRTKDGLQGQVRELTASRGELGAKVDELGKARVVLETRVNDLTKSRDDLQKMVGSLADTRGALEKQVADLTKAKNAALEDARNAQAKVDVLNDKLKAQTQQIVGLQDQIKTIRSVLEQLQKKLE